METPVEYKTQVNSGIITSDILSACIYSVNKRAKNFRDRARAARKDRREDYEAAKEKENYYDMKEELLSVVDPVCIHKEPVKRSCQILDTMPEYKDYYIHAEYVKVGRFVEKGKNYFTNFLITEVDGFNYYLYFRFENGYSFHRPITEEEIQNYPDLNIVDIDPLKTEGKSIESLVSMQFVTKVVALIKSGHYVYQN